MITIGLFALGPALSVSSGDLFAFVRSGARSLTGSRRARRSRNVLVVAQFALTLVVLTGAGLLARSLDRMQRLNLGFDDERLDAIELRFTGRETTPLVINDVIDRLRTRLSGFHGVASVAAGIQTPFVSGGIDGWVSAEGESSAQHTRDPFVDLEFVTPNYFRTLGVRILAGRSFDDADLKATTPVVVVSKSIADHYWPGQSAVGKRLHCFGGDELCPVVGIAGDTHYRDLVTPHLILYRLSRQAPENVFAPRVLFVAAHGAPAELLPSIRSIINNYRTVRYDRPRRAGDGFVANAIGPAALQRGAGRGVRDRRAHSGEHGDFRRAGLPRHATHAARSAFATPWARRRASSAG